MNFCTLFDSIYLSRGLAMFDSLKKHCDNFHLYVFAFDNNCAQFLKELNEEKLTIITLSEFEDEQLLKIKPTRSRGEYCWTCSSSIILYVLNNFDVECCTYLDADLFFFSSPQPLFDEMGDASVLITPHRYTPKYDQSEKTGIYCVQFITFKKDERGLKILSWWRNACLQWCYNRIEDNKFGDQKYLDDWIERFEGIHVLEHLGGGVAPWNMQKYEFSINDKKLTGKELKTDKKFDVIFFHFHSLMFITPKLFSSRPYYERNKTVMQYCFNPYAKVIIALRNKYSFINSKEKYLHGFKLFKYFAELFFRRGFSEIKYHNILHKKDR